MRVVVQPLPPESGGLPLPLEVVFEVGGFLLRCICLRKRISHLRHHVRAQSAQEGADDRLEPGLMVSNGQVCVPFVWVVSL